MADPAESTAPTFTEAQHALLALIREAAEFEHAFGGSITKAVADWFAQQYALAAKERLDATERAERMAILHSFAQDWALLRKGELSAQRLELERERLIYVKNDSLGRYKRKIIVGLEAFTHYVKRSPEAKAAFDELARLVRHPFDPDEREADPAESNR